MYTLEVKVCLAQAIHVCYVIVLRNNGLIKIGQLQFNTTLLQPPQLGRATSWVLCLTSAACGMECARAYAVDQRYCTAILLKGFLLHVNAGRHFSLREFRNFKTIAPARLSFNFDSKNVSPVNQCSSPSSNRSRFELYSVSSCTGGKNIRKMFLSAARKTKLFNRQHQKLRTSVLKTVNSK
jgi:hypothetical protein